MNFNETEKVNLSVKNKPEIVSKIESPNSISPTPVEEKITAPKENILIKTPEPLNIRELFQDKAERGNQVKVNYREKQITETTAKNIKEAEIKISKSTDEVIKLIKQSKADLPKIENKISVPSENRPKEIVKKDEPDPRLNKIIQEEISKLKEEIKKPAEKPNKESGEPVKFKIAQPQQKEPQNIQPKAKAEIPVPEKSESVKTEKVNNESPKTIIKIQEDLNKEKLAATTTKLVKAPQPIIDKKIEERKPEVIKEPVVKEQNEIPPKEILEKETPKSVSSKKGLVELSSLTQEEKRTFFKAQKEKEKNNHKTLFKILIPAALVVIISIVLFSIFSGSSEKVASSNLLAQTKSETTSVVVNQINPQESQVSANEKPQTEQRMSNPTPNTEELSLPPLPEIQAMDAPIANLLKENSGSNENQTKNLTEEKTEVIPPKENKIEEEEPAYFVVVEQMPEPIGGLADIQKRVIYPSVALQTGIEGKVYVRAMVNEAGVVTQTEILKGIGAGCDEAAADAVAKTKFKPGIQRGKPVKVQLTIPIVFKKGQ
jgi:protein TonB